MRWLNSVTAGWQLRCVVRCLLAGFVLLQFTSAATAADRVDFVQDVRPILKKHCYACHAAEKQKSGLRLDIRSEAFRGGEAFGEAIVAGHAEDSPLIQVVSGPDADLVMPPESEPLSAAEVSVLTRWVNEGAIWPDGVDEATLVDRRDHWSFHPLQAPEIPDTDFANRTVNPIDRFIAERLQQNQLQPAAEADRVTWLRRVTLDLTGLLPTSAEVRQFLADDSDQPWARVVDRLLASPRYGERWAQHWLDVVRYADTHGFEVNTERPHAWPYRDYVIEAFNRDTAYDQFIREQIAGDNTDQEAATGFLITASVLLPGQIGKDEPSRRLARQDSLDEIVVNIGQTFLALSVGCARCHDHKFDPVSQEEYYSMQAFIAGVEYADRPLQSDDAVRRRQRVAELDQQIAHVDRQLIRFAPPALLGFERDPINARQNVDRFPATTTRRLRFTIKATNRLEPCVDELEIFNTDLQNVALAEHQTTVRSSGDTVNPDRHELRLVHDGRYGNSSSWMSSEDGRGWLVFEFARPETIDMVVWGRDRTGRFSDRLATNYHIEVEQTDGSWQTVATSADRLASSRKKKSPAPSPGDWLTAEEEQQRQQLQATRKQHVAEKKQLERYLQAFAGTFRTPDDIHLLFRGDPEQPRERVSPAVLSVLGDLQLPTDASDRERRETLADWIASPNNTLTARVMVNRIWQGHFGTGLVETASDFGRSGAAPSHPELLDWLALEFMQAGWSVKHMHRLIVLSATYRQSGQFQAEAAAKDADARLLWRFPSRRLDAETIRDVMLQVSGQLNPATGGPGFDLFDKRGGLTGFKPVEHFSGEGLKRMIYAHKVRRERDGVFGAFDCPDAGQSTSRRRESATPVQALNLFNSPFTMDAAQAFAERVQQATSEGDVEEQIQTAYELALNRHPRAAELAAVRPVVEQHDLMTLCRVLLNSNEFLFLP